MIFFRIFLLAIVCAAVQFFYPWWTMAIAALVFGFVFGQNGIRSFIIGLLGVGVVWFVYAFYLDLNNDNILSSRVAELFGLSGLSDSSGISSSILLLLVTALIGGFIGGLSCTSGSFFRAMFKKKP